MTSDVVAESYVASASRSEGRRSRSLCVAPSSSPKWLRGVALQSRSLHSCDQQSSLRQQHELGSSSSSYTPPPKIQQATARMSPSPRPLSSFRQIARRLAFQWYPQIGKLPSSSHQCHATARCEIPRRLLQLPLATSTRLPSLRTIHGTYIHGHVHTYTCVYIYIYIYIDLCMLHAIHFYTTDYVLCHSGGAVPQRRRRSHLSWRTTGTVRLRPLRARSPPQTAGYANRRPQA